MPLTVAPAAEAAPAAGVAPAVGVAPAAAGATAVVIPATVVVLVAQAAQAAQVAQAAQAVPAVPAAVRVAPPAVARVTMPARGAAAPVRTVPPPTSKDNRNPSPASKARRFPRSLRRPGTPLGPGARRFGDAKNQ